MIVPVRIKAGTKEIKTYVMLDSGATRPIINEGTAKRLDTKWEARKPDLGKRFPLLLKQLCNNSPFQHVQMLWLDPIQNQDDGGTPILKINTLLYRN